MRGFVADASATFPWCFEEECTPGTEALLDRLRSGETAIVPAHWPAAAIPIRIEPPHSPGNWDAVIQVAMEYKLTIYDAAYLELASRIALPLASLDGDLRKAALAAGLVLSET